MYHTFQATKQGEEDGAKGARPPGSRRISTSNACVCRECAIFTLMSAVFVDLL